MTDSQAIPFGNQDILLFDVEGHLTDNAFKGLIQETLSPLQSLEVSEHLSYCDECISRYTDLLCEDYYITPLQPIMPDVMVKIKNMKRNLYINKFFSATIAASFALIYCIGNMFMSDYSFRPDRIVERLGDSSQAIFEQTQRVTEEISDSFDQIWDDIVRFNLSIHN